MAQFKNLIREQRPPGLVTSPLRIVSPAWKTVYVALAIAIPLTLNPLLWLVPIEGVTLGLSVLLDIALIGLGVRTFRGPREPVLPPRAYWRATSRPASGYVIAGVFTTLGFSLGVAAPPSESSVLAGWVTTVELLALAAFYLQSAIRLTRRP